MMYFVSGIFSLDTVSLCREAIDQMKTQLSFQVTIKLICIMTTATAKEIPYTTKWNIKS